MAQTEQPVDAVAAKPVRAIKNRPAVRLPGRFLFLYQPYLRALVQPVHLR